MTRAQMWGWRVGCIAGVYAGQWALAQLLTLIRWRLERTRHA